MIIRCKGIKITVDYFAPMMVSLMLIIDKSGIMSMALLSAVLHELGHALMILLCRGKIKQIGVYPWGIILRCHNVRQSELERLLILCAGPAVNCLMWLLFRGIYPQFALVNLISGIFNMLPCAELDGGDIVLILLRIVFSESVAQVLLTVTTVLLSLVFVSLGVYCVLQSLNPTLLLIGIYLVSIMLLKQIRGGNFRP